VKSLPQTHDVCSPTYRVQPATHVQRETPAVPAARVRAPRESAAGRFLDRTDDSPIDQLGGSKITADGQLAARGRRCPGVSSGPACGKNGPGRVNGTSPTDQAAASGWLSGGTPSERGQGSSSDRAKRLPNPATLRCPPCRASHGVRTAFQTQDAADPGVILVLPLGVRRLRQACRQGDHGPLCRVWTGV
jgi:hypothetical protein